MCTFSVFVFHLLGNEKEIQLYASWVPYLIDTNIKKRLQNYYLFFNTLLHVVLEKYILVRKFIYFHNKSKLHSEVKNKSQKLLKNLVIFPWGLYYLSCDMYIWAVVEPYCKCFHYFYFRTSTFTFEHFNKTGDNWNVALVALSMKANRIYQKINAANMSWNGPKPLGWHHTRVTVIQFPITDPSGRESTGDRWISLYMARNEKNRFHGIRFAQGIFHWQCYRHA